MRSTWGPGRILLTLGGAAVLGGVLLGGGGAAAVLAATDGGAGQDLLDVLPDIGPADPVDPDAPIEGVETFGPLTNRHSDGPVDYEQVPPVGGDHAPVWQDCGFYEVPVPSEQAVHSLEHGAVWVTFDPDLPEDEVERLEELTARHGYLLVSPMDDLPSAVVASAWGVQLQLGSADDERLDAFLLRYLQGDQTPEPGAPCSGGSSSSPGAGSPA